VLDRIADAAERIADSLEGFREDNLQPTKELTQAVKNMNEFLQSQQEDY
jgi:uncharacterized protein Yka (UPF0111/DUF47 family)